MRNCIPAPAVGKRLTWSRHPEPRRRRRISSAGRHRILRSFAVLRMTNTSPSGGMADAVDSKSTALWGMPVRVRPRAPQRAPLRGALSVVGSQLSVLGLQTTKSQKSMRNLLILAFVLTTAGVFADVGRPQTDNRQPTTDNAARSAAYYHFIVQPEHVLTTADIADLAARGIEVQRVLPG